MISRPAHADKSDTESQIWIGQYDQAMQVLNNSTDAKGNKPKVIQLPEPDPEKIHQLPASDVKKCKDIDIDCEDGATTSYLNFYIVNGGIVMPEFGNVVADRNAQEIVRAAFPGRKVCYCQH